MFALVDGNNFYASCEHLFQPELRGKPLVVLRRGSIGSRQLAGNAMQTGG